VNISQPAFFRHFIPKFGWFVDWDDTIPWKDSYSNWLFSQFHPQICLVGRLKWYDFLETFIDPYSSLQHCSKVWMVVDVFLVGPFHPWTKIAFINVSSKFDVKIDMISCEYFTTSFFLPFHPQIWLVRRLRWYDSLKRFLDPYSNWLFFSVSPPNLFGW